MITYQIVVALDTVLDRCYNNTSCGPNGECINLPFKKTFTCRCRLFYDGKKCEMCKWS